MKISKEFKLGAFAVFVLAVSFFVINFLRGKDILDKEYELVSRYDNLEGLVSSAPVYIKGYKAGQVSDVEYDSPSGYFKVTCSILKEFAVPVDSKMTIYSVDIMGGKGVRIDLGDSQDMAVDGTELAPAMAPDLIGGLTQSVGPLLGKLSDTLDSLGVTVSSVNSLLSSDNQKTISDTFTHLEATMKDVRSIVKSVEGKSDDLENFLSSLSSLSDRLVVLMDNADTAVVSATAVLESIAKSDIEKVVSSINTLLENINDPNGTVGQLFVDKSIYYSVDSILKQADELVRIIKENPKKYLKLSVF